MDFIVANWDQIIVGLLAVLGGFAQLAQLTPNENDNKIIQGMLSFVNRLGGNNGKAANKE